MLWFVRVQLLCGDVSESGGLGVCSSEDGRLWVWDPDDGETRVCVQRRSKQVSDVVNQFLVLRLLKRSLPHSVSIGCNRLKNIFSLSTG